MKKLFALVFVLFLGTNFTHAQNPQNNLISWNMSEFPTPLLGFPNPKGWISGNLLGITTDTIVSQVQGMGPGTFAARIKTGTIPGLSTQTGGLISDVNGIMITGSVIPALPPQLKPGFPYSDRPEYIDFYSKYIPNGVDTAFVLAVLYKRSAVGQPIDTIATAYYQETDTTTEFTYHQLMFDYRQPLIASNPATDSLLIVISSSSRITPQLGSRFYITSMDDNWAGLFGVNKNATNELYPNPSNNFFSITNATPDLAKYSIMDISGKVVKSENVYTSTSKIGISDLPNGVYFVKLFSKTNTLIDTKKLSINR